eukprot:55666-Eustigmatos_ZCMA.PRE.1
MSGLLLLKVHCSRSSDEHRHGAGVTAQCSVHQRRVPLYHDVRCCSVAHQQLHDTGLSATCTRVSRIQCTGQKVSKY